MRQLIPLLSLLVCAAAHAQIPNPGFENWSSGSPVGWYSVTAALPGSIQQSNIAHGDQWAARGNVVSFSGFSAPPLLSAGSTGLGFPVNQRHGSLTGYYRYTPGVDDMFVIIVSMVEGGSVIGGGGFTTTTPATSYTQFTVPIAYGTGGTPDTCAIQFLISDSTGTVEVGSYYIVDDLAFGGITGVAEAGAIPPEFTLHPNYPNPFNPSTQISFSLPSPEHVTLTVFDALGRRVAVLVDEAFAAGSYNRSWDASGSPSGVYFCRMRAGSFTEVRKLLLMR